MSVSSEKVVALNSAANERQALQHARRLTLLDQEADGLLAKLSRLRQHLAEMRREARENATPLVEVNEQLMLAALHAQKVAETAVDKLREAARSSQRDPLTDLPNRALMLGRLEREMVLARRHGLRIAVLFIDLDDFKQINDTLGHVVGDQVLQLVARRLRGAIRNSDSVSRYGGEEFLAVLPDIAQPSDAAGIARKLQAAIALPSHVGEHRLSLSASIGIAIYPDDADDAQQLIDRADTAMYRAKQRSHGEFEFYADRAALMMRRAAQSGDAA